MSSELAEPRTRQPGDFVFRHYHYAANRVASALVYNCPCGCGDQGWLPLYRSPESKPTSTAWEWDGNEIAPTLKPSIRRLIACKWHGFLTAGTWSSAGDGAPNAPNVYNASGVSANPSNVAPNQPIVSPEAHVNPSKIPAVPSKAAEPLIADHSSAVPPGFSKTLELCVINGRLYQLHQAGHPGDTTQIWVPIRGQGRDSQDEVDSERKRADEHIAQHAEVMRQERDAIARDQVNREHQERSPSDPGSDNRPENVGHTGKQPELAQTAQPSGTQGSGISSPVKDGNVPIARNQPGLAPNQPNAAGQAGA